MTSVQEAERRYIEALREAQRASALPVGFYSDDTLRVLDASVKDARAHLDYTRRERLRELEDLVPKLQQALQDSQGVRADLVSRLALRDDLVARLQAELYCCEDAASLLGEVTVCIQDPVWHARYREWRQAWSEAKQKAESDE